MSLRAGSLQRALTLTVITIVGVALAVVSAATYSFYSRGSRERFDERLAEAAQAAALMVGTEGILPSALETDLLPSLDQSRGATSLQIWNEVGSVLARYPPQAGVMLPPQRGPPRFETVPLPDGGEGRLYVAWLEADPKATAAAASGRVGIAVLRDTALLERRLARLRHILGTTTIGTMALVGLIVWLVIRRLVRGMARLSATIGSIDAFALGERLDVAGLPEELRPPFTKVNDLLSRVEEVLNRERQFSADVSHELRTPLAGLRTILEVSGTRPRSASEQRATLQEALGVVRQIEAIVENLLALARLRAGHLIEEHPEEISIGSLVNSCFEPLTDLADTRGLQFDNSVGPTASILGDNVKLRLITSNLLSNAVQYTAEGGWIIAESEPAGGIVLRVRDSGPSIPESALAKIFDPFFQVEPSRSGDGEHFGIGLTLVRGLCETCGYRVVAENEPGGGVAFTVTRPPGPAAQLDGGPAGLATTA